MHAPSRLASLLPCALRPCTAATARCLFDEVLLGSVSELRGALALAERAKPTPRRGNVYLESLRCTLGVLEREAARRGLFCARPFRRTSAPVHRFAAEVRRHHLRR